MNFRKALLGLPLVLLLIGCSTASAPASPAPDPGATHDDVVADILPECEGFIFDEGEEVAGSIVAACVIATMVAHNYGKMTVEGTDTNGLTIFRQAPVFAAQVELGNDQKNELFIDGDTMWFKDNLGWVRAIEGSSDMREVQAYAIANTFRGLSDPLVAVSMLESATTWTIVGDEEIVRPVDETTRSAWRFDAVPFDFAGVHIDSLSLWLDNDYTTLQQHAVSSAMGYSATTLNRYYDWGVEEEFIAPVE